MDRAEAIGVLTIEQASHRKDGLVERAIDMAIAALREQEQREQGCDWCNDLQSRPCHACSIGYDHFDCGKGHPRFKMLPYKYCPMCGRKLGGAE